MNHGAPAESTALKLGTLVKVPAIGALFWVTKLLTTGMGETLSDFLNHSMPPPIAVSLGFIAFLVVLAAQLRAPRYVPWLYWMAVSLVSVFGTMAADAIHVGLGVPYTVSTILWAFMLAVVLATWRWRQGSLSIHTVTRGEPEVFYWATVLATFALGTAAGDLTATTFGLGYFASGLLFSAIILIPAAGYRFFRFNGVFAFWFAYIITRPIGASFSDWAGVSRERGGLGLGTGPVSLSLTVVIVALVWRLQLRDGTPQIPAPS